MKNGNCCSSDEILASIQYSVQLSVLILLLMSFPVAMNNASYSLFIGDLSVFCTREDLEQLFSPFGTITDIRIKQDMNTGKKLSYGFVEFDNINSAINVIKHMNGYVLCGRPMRIRWGANKTVKKPDEPVKKVVSCAETASVHVSFCVTMPNAIVSEETLRYIFSEFGFVVDATVKKAVCSYMRGSNEGYGFVHYANTPQGIESAINAVGAMNNVTVGSVHFRVGLSMSLEKKLNELMNNPMYGAPPAIVPPQHVGAGYFQPQPMMFYPCSMPQYVPAAAAPLGTYYLDHQGPPSPVNYVPPAPAPRLHSHRHYTPYVSSPKSVVSEATAPPAVKTLDEPIVKNTYKIESNLVKVAPIDSPACTPSFDATKSSTSTQDLQHQLDEARDDCGAYKHSTIDVYMDVQEHVACINIADY